MGCKVDNCIDYEWKIVLLDTKNVFEIVFFLLSIKKRSALKRKWWRKVSQGLLFLFARAKWRGVICEARAGDISERRILNNLLPPALTCHLLVPRRWHLVTWHEPWGVICEARTGDISTRGYRLFRTLRSEMSPARASQMTPRHLARANKNNRPRETFLHHLRFNAERFLRASK